MSQSEAVYYIDAVEMYVKRANLHGALYPDQCPDGLHDIALRELERQGRVARIPPGPTWLGGWHWTPMPSAPSEAPAELTQGSPTETV